MNIVNSYVIYCILDYYYDLLLLLYCIFIFIYVFVFNFRPGHQNSIYEQSSKFCRAIYGLSYLCLKRTVKTFVGQVSPILNLR